MTAKWMEEFYGRRKKKEIDVAVIEVTEEYLKEKLYKIRGKRVLLDADLAEIYGYDTKGFNRQVKNNIEKFDEDFMFELTDEELEDLRYKNCTANISSKSRYNPHVFTEQGLYMLMTVLKGPLAVKQSKALIRTFKKMKDYILENRDLIGQREILQLSMETANNRIEINKINSDMISLEKQISDVAEGLKDVVIKSELADMMNSFVSDDDEKWLMFNAKFSSADEVYESIYKQAKSSIYVVDNYIGLRTLVHLKNSPTGVAIILFSDNVGNNKLHNIMNNIRMGNENVTTEEVMEAAKKASCHNFMMSLPDGYDTMVGEGGSTLSGGEKQRIFIARALLKDAPIVLLDEATASLDPENEVLIQSEINSLVQEKTVIIVAHRLQSIANADQVVLRKTGGHLMPVRVFTEDEKKIENKMFEAGMTLIKKYGMTQKNFLLSH